ncbi:GNAT family N-acetyltransferase [Kouleothrix sp.]|uniref:GNAT family N-acetyltransferase n=1 Tax=Kouleothrix sp. TaxID=2779161 RepID=UPI00391BD80C
MTGAIGALTVAELGLADELLVAAYGGPSRRKRLASYLALQPDGWVLAWLDGAPAGVGGVMHYGPVAYVGLVGVAPAYRRRGVARAIMAHLLGWLAERGGPVVLLDASASGAPLYEQLGFTDDEKTVVFVQDDCARRPPEPAQVHALAPADLAAVAEFDEPIFGAGRAAVFELLRAEAPERAFVARDGGGIAGYLFAQDALIGPWAARTPAVAEALLGAALRLEYHSAPTVLAPGSNPDVARLLMRYGFSPARSLRHMRLGGAGPVGQRAWLYALTSFAIG